MMLFSHKWVILEHTENKQLFYCFKKHVRGRKKKITEIFWGHPSLK